MARTLLLLIIALFALAMPALAAVDVNKASASELETLPGIGPSKASAIIDYRTQNGPFTSVDSLDDVPGIGPSTLANIRPLVVLGDGVAAAPASPADSDSPPASSASSGPKVNVNTASAATLESLPGIGPSKASLIVADREANGPYASCDDLQRVNGIGPATVRSLRELCATE